MFRYVSRLGVFAAIAAALALSSGPLFAQANAADKLLGNWRMDRSKSVFTGAVPEWRTMTFEKAGNNVKHTTQTMQGEVVYKLQYNFQVDGKDYPADNQMSVSTVAFKRVDANTLERTGKYQGMVTETVTYTLSPDGKMLTAVQKLTANPDQINSTQVFTKEP
jgi:hypothetical protein